MTALKGSGAKAYSKDTEDLKAENEQLKVTLSTVAERIGGLSSLLHGSHGELTAEALLLSGEEVQEAALRAAYLAHYWGLARRLGIMEPMAAAQEAQWAQVAPPASFLHAAAAEMARRVTQYANNQVSKSGHAHEQHETAAAATHGQLSPTSSSGACVADCVSIERALRCLVALGVPMRVRETVAEAAHNAAAGASKVTDADDPSTCSAAPPLLPDTCQAVQEAQWLSSWLCYIWGRAALSGILPTVSLPYAEEWAARSSRSPRTLQAVLQQLADGAAAELALYQHDVEVLLWQRR